MKDKKIFVVVGIILVLLIFLFFFLSNGKSKKDLTKEGIGVTDVKKDDVDYIDIQNKDYSEPDRLVLDAMIAKVNNDKEKMLQVLHSSVKEDFLNKVKDSESWNKPIRNNKFESSVADYTMKRYDHDDRIYYRFDYSDLETPSNPGFSKVSAGYGFVEVVKIDDEWSVMQVGDDFERGSKAYEAVRETPDSIVDVIYNEELYQHLPKNKK